MASVPESTPTPGRPIAGDRAFIIINEAAGSVGAGDRERLAETLRAAGFERCAFIGPETMNRRLMSRAKDFDVLIVLGGDGTARAAAELAPPDGPPLILLPGGTMNLLPKVLYGARAWPEALTEALARGVIKRLPMGRANSKRFFIAGFFGAPTLLARAREAMREGKPMTALRRLNHFARRSFLRSLRACPDGCVMQPAEAIGVLCPSFAGALEGDQLEWVRLDAGNIVDLVRLGVSAMSPGWRDDPAVDIRLCNKGQIRSAGVIPATLDGEPRVFVSSVRITYDLRGPRVIALAPDED
jgi:diacylglycerol kinase family enzyme